MADDNVDIVVNNFVSSIYLDMITQNKLNAKINSKFENLEVQEIQDNQQLAGYNFASGIAGKISITEEKCYNDGKSLKIIVPEGGLYTTIKSEEIRCVQGQMIINSARWYYETESTAPGMRFNTVTHFFDEDGNEINYTKSNIDYASINSTNSTQNEWNRPCRFEKVIVPPKASKYSVTYVINPLREGNVYLSDFYTTVQ